MLETKKKNKLLKTAVVRLQNEFDRLKEHNQVTEQELQMLNFVQSKLEQPADPDSGTFITRVSEDSAAKMPKPTTLPSLRVGSDAQSMKSSDRSLSMRNKISRIFKTAHSPSMR